MKRSIFFSAVTCAALAVAAGFGGPMQTAFAQSDPAQIDSAQVPPLDSSEAASQPVAVVSLSGVAGLGNAAVYLSEAAGQPATGGMFATMARGFTTGIDPNRPIGLILNMKDGAPAPLLFVPSQDIKVFLRRMEGQLGPAEELEDDPNTLVIAAGASLLYIKQAGDWAFAAQDREALSDLPADPLKMLGGLHETYDIAARLNVQRVPAAQREMLIAALKQGFQEGMARQAAAAGGDDEAANEARRVAEASIAQLEREIQNTESLMFGFAADRERERAFIDVVATAVEGSDTADIYENTFALPSKFASVIRPEAAAYYHASASVSPKAVQRMRDSIDQSMQTYLRQLDRLEELNEAQKEELTGFLRRFVELAIDTVSEGKVDVGAQLDLGDSGPKMFGGAFVSDGSDVADLLKGLAEKLQGDPQMPTFSFDEGKYQEITLHTVTVKIADKEVAEVLGDELTIKLGTGPDAVYFAAGSEAEATLKQLIDSGAEDPAGAQRPLGQFYMSLTPFARMVERVAPGEIVSAVLQAAENSDQTDRVLVVTSKVPRGQAFRLIIGEGIFRAAGAGAAAAGQAQPAGAEF
ncbi:hypothetical protein [Roseimaritima sediminicola]|uniref:hypothetical protein n=1 Tax=Roseimaritima sediminicola TaxID=2662066 RepID=UPI001298491C|nr:hypothetical protein [Roseimaritima sediminicola]